MRQAIAWAVVFGLVLLGSAVQASDAGFERRRDVNDVDSLFRTVDKSIQLHIFDPQPPDEQAIFKAAARERLEGEGQRRFLADSSLDAYLQSICARLWRQVQTPLPEMKIHVLMDPLSDAYTYPDGVCYLTTGMLAAVSNEDELAMLLAHEMTHYTRRHALAAYTRLRGRQDDRGDIAALHRFGGPGSRSAQTNPCGFFQEAEQEADREGLQLMRAAGYHPEDGVELMRRTRSIPTHRDPAAPLTLSRSLLSGPQAGESARTGDYLRKIAPALLTNARALLQRGHWTQADDCLRPYLRMYPLDPRAHYLKGEIHRQNAAARAIESAVQAYAEAIRLDKCFAPAYKALGILYFKAGNKQKARHFFETFLALAPNGGDRTYIEGYLSLCTN